MTEQSRLETIKDDLQNEIYGGRLNFREVSIEDFFLWYQSQKANERKVEKISDLDVLSVIGLFENWVKRKDNKL